MPSFVHLLDQRRLIGPGGSTVSGELAFYYTGSSVLAPIFYDIGMSVPAPNPISVGAGQPVPTIFLNESIIYRRVITYSDGTYDETDPLGALLTEGEFGLPIGSIIDYAGPVAPDGFLLCYGQEVDRTEFEELFGAIGITYGPGNGSTTFNIPDYRGRVAAGKDNMGGVPSGRLSVGPLPSASILGAVGGTDAHLLSVSEMPNHGHTLTDPGHTHDLADTLRNSGGTGNTTADGTILAASNTTTSSTTGITLANTGGGLPHLNVQPTIIFNKIIKARATTFLSLLDLFPSFDQKANASAIGIEPSANNMGTFDGTTIPDNVTAKEALQVLETSLEDEINLIHDNFRIQAADWMSGNGSNELAQFQALAAYVNSFPNGAGIDWGRLVVRIDAGSVTFTKPVTFFGDSAATSKIRFQNNARIIFDGGTRSEYGSPIFATYNMGFETLGIHSSSPIRVQYNDGGTTLRGSLIMRDCWITGATGLEGFNTGLEAHNVGFLTLDEVRIMGDRSSTSLASQYGVKITGDGGSYDFRKLRIYFVLEAWNLTGNCEGITFQNGCEIVGVLRGIVATAETGTFQPYITIDKSVHINAEETCVKLDGFTEFTIDGQYYGQGLNDTGSGTWTAVDVSPGTVAGYTMNGLISCAVQGDGTFYPYADRIGIRVRGSATSTERVTIDTRLIQSVQTGIQLDANTNGCIVSAQAQDMMVNVAVPVLDNGDNTVTFTSIDLVDGNISFREPFALVAIVNGSERRIPVSADENVTSLLNSLLSDLPANSVINFPPCNLVATGNLTRNGGVSLNGHGSGSSRLTLNSNATLTINGGSVSYPNNQVSIQDILFSTDDTNHSNTMININFSGRDGVSGFFRTLYMKNVQLRGSDSNKGFMVGLHLTNCTNMLLDGVRVSGRSANDRAAGSTGFIIDGNEQPIDMVIQNSGAAFLDTCITANAGGVGQGMEGLFIDNFIGIFSNYGVVSTFTTVHDVVSVTNSNFNCYKKNLVFQNVHNVHVVGNTLYNAAASPSESTFVAIEIYNSDPAFLFPSNNVITNNRLFGSTETTPSQTGISINSINGASSDTLIDANNIADYDFPIQLFSGAALCRVTDTNNYRNFTLRVNNVGVNNLVQGVPIAIANLPSAASWPSGVRAIVNDANGPVFLSSLTAGGAATSPVFSDGVTWRVG